MEDPKNIIDELKSLDSSLHKKEKKNPFSVPGSYFESLNPLVQDKIAAAKEQTWAEKVYALLAEHKLIVATCMIALVFGSVYYFKNAGNTVLPDTDKMEMAFTDDEISTIAAEVDEHTISEVYAQTISTEIGEDVNDMEEYLIDNNIDINSLVNEL